ncbi:hypothetical protein SDC9_209112 [bioreactor metagenome]|uniref:Uncharacterized protein n=1 Tax=bioreactor metagenome TaxID=1076179 RepID=A0A645JD46_9ZZZZ
MAKGTFNGFVSRDGFKYSPEAIPEEVKQTIVALFIDNDKRKKSILLIINSKSDNNSEGS